MTLQELLDECRNNINSEVVFQEIVAEHDKQIRAEAFDDVMRLCDAYCHFDKAKHPSNGYVISRASLLDIVEQLKEQNK